jgi:excinuclease ABC subunit C
LDASGVEVEEVVGEGFDEDLDDALDEGEGDVVEAAPESGEKLLPRPSTPQLAMAAERVEPYGASGSVAAQAPAPASASAPVSASASAPVSASATAPASAPAPAAAANDQTPQTPAVDPNWELPDLLVVDGGRGQLNVALSAARDLGLHGLPIVGLAKERESPTSGEKTVDRVYLPGQKNGIPLRSTSSALFFLARARDEAHRFANHTRKKLGKARRLRSEIEDIRGLGPDAKKALLRELGSMAAVRRASDEQILAVTGITRRHLSALRKVIPAPEKEQGGRKDH